MEPRFAAFACALLVFAAGCSEMSPVTPAAASEIVNTHCPVMGGEVDGQTFVEWNGKKVGFCCPPCIDDWKDMEDAERSAKLAKAGANADSSEDSSAPKPGEHDNAQPTGADAEQSDENTAE